MTPLRKKLLDFIRDYHDEFARYPTAREIATLLALRYATVVDNLRVMRHLGYVKLSYGRITAMRMPGTPALPKQVSR